MESPSDLPVIFKTFATSRDATTYLEHEGFTFQGAPDRWLHIEENGPVYARIVPKVGTFQVRLCWYTKQS
jgi:hypothetical protein